LYVQYKLNEKIMSDMIESRKKFNDVFRADLNTEEFESLIAAQARYNRLITLTDDADIKAKYQEKLNSVKARLDEITATAANNSQAQFEKIWQAVADGVRSRSPELASLITENLGAGLYDLTETMYKNRIGRLREEEKSIESELAATNRALSIEQSKLTSNQDKAQIRTWTKQQIDLEDKLAEKAIEISQAEAEKLDTSKITSKTLKEEAKDMEKVLSIQKAVNDEMTDALSRIKEYQTESGAIKPYINIQADAEAALETFNRRMKELDSEAERAEAEFNIGTRTAESLGRKLEEIRTYKIMLYKELLADLRRFQALVLNVLAVLPPGSPLATGLMTLFNGLSVEINKAEKETAEYLGVTLSLWRGLMGVFNEVLNVISRCLVVELAHFYRGL